MVLDARETLYMVLPAYNEEATIAAVAREWHAVLVQQGGPDSRLMILDDGSKDQTAAILQGLQNELPQLLVITKPNSGHGSTIRMGYALALEQGADYIFQTDSDGQTEPGEFACLWREREHFAALIGHRVHRGDGPARVLVAFVLRTLILLLFGVSVTDANTPFRLIRRDALSTCLKQIPEGFFLTNALMSVLLARHQLPVRYVPITFHPRQAGKNSIRLSKIVPIGWRALREFWQVRRSLR
ncbi:MAG: glycosyltransferase family 2 protein [Eubacteriales bacterium]|nr:glycosyltransferase family 2 protein [Eubacteriales bacterium]